MKTVVRALSRLKDLLYPTKCVACGELLSERGGVFCRACFDSYENAKQQICSRCFHPRCRCTCPSFGLGKAGLRRLVKLYRYQPSEGDLPENRILYALKQKRLQNVFDFLSGELSESIDEALTQREKETAILVPCPRSDAAKRKNGYDHTVELCRSLSKITGYPVSFALRRAPGGSVQKKLSSEERLRNVSGRFSVANGVDLTGKTVLLVDDVTTSGATILECRRAVKRAGASRIVPCVIAVSGRDFVLRPKKERKKGKSYHKKSTAPADSVAQSNR